MVKPDLSNAEMDWFFFPPICFDLLKVIFDLVSSNPFLWGIYIDICSILFPGFLQQIQEGILPWFSWASPLMAKAHYPTLLRPRSEGREFSLLATAFDPELRAGRPVDLKSGALKTR